MGYTDISIYGSDMASDLAYTVAAAMVKELEKGLKEKDDYGANTEGPENVACFLEELILPNAKMWAKISYGKLHSLAAKAMVGLQEKIAIANNPEGWNTEKNRLEHVASYDRLLRSLNKFIAICEE